MQQSIDSGGIHGNSELKQLIAAIENGIHSSTGLFSS
jgi:hypothetical protein